MSNAAVATTLFGVFMVATVALGLLAVRGKGGGGGLAEWSVGGRSLGAVFVWVLMAGEGYTSFSYLGAAGWGYNYGAPVLYVVAYMSCGYAIGYVVGPLLWSYARQHGLVSITDMVAHRFGRPWLGAGCRRSRDRVPAPVHPVADHRDGRRRLDDLVRCRQPQLGLFHRLRRHHRLRRRQRVAGECVGFRSQRSARHRHARLPRHLRTSSLLRRVRGLSRAAR